MRTRPREIEGIQSLPEINRENSDLQEFFLPIDEIYSMLVRIGDQLPWLRRYDKCPRRLLPLLASIIGCQLPTHRMATETEQRNLIKWWSWCCTYKGTLAAVSKLCSVLGFATTFIESARAAAIWTQSPFYHYDEHILSRIVDDIFDGTQSASWEKRLAGSDWLQINGHCEGTGDGNDDLDNNYVFKDYQFDSLHLQQCYQVDFEVVGGSGSLHPSFGIVPYSSSLGEGSFIRFESYGGEDYVKSYMLWAGTPMVISSQIITGLVAYKTGVHHLRVWDFDSIVQVGIDDQMVATGLLVPPATCDQGHAGLVANQSTHMYFDNFTVDRLGISSFSHFFGTDPYERHLLIKYTYAGEAAQKAGKLEYLGKILLGFVPVGVDIEFEEV